LSSSSLIDQQQNNHKPVRNLSNPRSKKALLEWARMGCMGGLFMGLYVWIGGPELLFLAAAVGFLMVGGLLLYLCGPKRIEINRMISPIHAIAGETVMVTVQVRFRSRIPLPWMIITDHWSGGIEHQELLFPGFRRSFIYTYSLPKVTRGFHRLENCCMKWGDIPGWFTDRKYSQEHSEFKALPSPLYFGRISLESGENRGSSADLPHSRSREEGMEIRQYMPGDPLNRIHWKSSARHGTLQSRTPERGNDRMICIVLDNTCTSYAVPFGELSSRSKRGSEAPAFEKAVSAVMGLLRSAERSDAYIQLFCGGWPEGTARHEGLGKIPIRVLNILTEIKADSTRTLTQLLEDAASGWIPGMSIAVVTGGLEQESAKVMAKLLTYGVKINLYYAWDRKAPNSGPEDITGGTIGESLKRLGAGLYRLDQPLTVYSQGVDPSESREQFNR